MKELGVTGASGVAEAGMEGSRAQGMGAEAWSRAAGGTGSLSFPSPPHPQPLLSTDLPGCCSSGLMAKIPASLPRAAVTSDHK